MAEASAHKLSYVKEDTRGTTPTNPRFQRLPDTRTTIALQKDTLSSERLTGTRFPSVPRTGAKTVTGDIPADLSYAAYNDFIASALQGPFIPQGTAPADTPSPDGAFTYGTRLAGEDTCTLSVSASANLTAPITINLVNAGSTWASASGTITVESVDADAGEVVILFDDGSGDSPATFNVSDNNVIDGENITLDAVVDAQRISQAKAGDTRCSFSILREFSDFGAGTKPFLLFNGCEVTTWNLTAESNGLATSTFTFFGRGGGAPESAEPSGTSYVEPIDTEPFDTFSGDMKIDGVSQCIVTSYNLSINNGLAARYTVGCPESIDPMVGRSVVEGSITVYFEDEVLYEKFIEETFFALELTLQDSLGNQLVINLPRLRALSGTQPDVSADGSITLPINFSAHLEDTLGTHIAVTSVEAP